MADPSIFIQPPLQMSVATAALIASGEASRIGGVVREIGTGRLVELLSDAPNVEDVVEEVARQVKKVNVSKFDLSKLDLPKLDGKTAAKAGGLLLVAGIAVGGFKWVMDRREAGEAVVPADVVVEELVRGDSEDPECLVNFRASLKAYIDAGLEGRLDSKVVDGLVADLDAVEAYSEEGNAVVFTLDELLPFFELVTAHTPILANAYAVDLDEQVEDDEGGVVISLRRHLEAQKRILAGAA